MLMQFRRVSLSLLLGCVGLSLWAQPRLSPTPALAAGQPPGVPATSPKHCDEVRGGFTNCRPNLVEGNELNRPHSVAVDPATGAVYVADTLNNRVLGWRVSAAVINGARADIVIGQRDLLSVSAGGPGTSLQNGLSQPTAVAVDPEGNVFVADAGNNRILRFPRPFLQPEELKLADLVIGQPGLNSKTPNTGGRSAKSISTVSGSAALRTALAFDSAGNLWFTDAGNHRVLRYPKSAIGPGAAHQPDADLVLGQVDFQSAVRPGKNTTGRTTRTGLSLPSALAFDAGGRLFVADELLRVLVYAPPLATAMPASRLLGIVVVAQGEPVPPVINARSTGLIVGSSWLPAEGLFTLGSAVFVVDTPAHRILRFAPYEEWPEETSTAVSPAAVEVIGQNSLESAAPVVHRGRAEPGPDTLLDPIGVAVGADGKVYVADAGNSRVLAFQDLRNVPGVMAAAQTVLGQPGFPNRAPNRIEGKEFYFTGGLTGGLTAAGLAIDRNADPPHLYVADTNNHRVLCFRDARRVRSGSFADLVIGQPDGFRALANYPTNNASTPVQTGLVFPVGLAVDAGGNLYVADYGNGRVVRFPRPFDQPPGLPQADLVLGQLNFTSKVTDATSRTMAGPWGLHFSVEGDLLVSDALHHRVLLFERPFESGEPAVRVFGQPDFSSAGAGSEPNQVNGPLGVSADSTNHLYVADNGNNRVLVFPDYRNEPGAPRASVVLSGLRNPWDVFVSPWTDQAWVADTNNSRIVRYRRFEQLLLGNTAPEPDPLLGSALALAEDGFGNLFLADALNRVAAHFPLLAVANGANFLPRDLPANPDQVQVPGRIAPGMIASLFFLEPRPIELQVNTDPVRLPKELGDVRVLVDGDPSPLYFVSSGQINFLVPNGAPTSGFVEITAVRASSGQTLASARVSVDVAFPGFFTRPEGGVGQIAAVNATGKNQGKINNAQNPIGPGDYISLFATGAGPIPGAPPDGERPPPGMLVSTPVQPQVLINGAPAEVQFSGLSPEFPGLWQINVKVPAAVLDGDMIVVMLMRDRISGDPDLPPGKKIVTTIAVKR